MSTKTNKSFSLSLKCQQITTTNLHNYITYQAITHAKTRNYLIYKLTEILNNITSARTISNLPALVRVLYMTLWRKK